MRRRIEIVPVDGIGEVEPGDALGSLLAGACDGMDEPLGRDDVVVISQKIVSKAEGRVRDLGSVQVDAHARDIATQLDKDPRLVQLALAESRRVLRADRRALIVETHGGWICANAGIDGSNIQGPGKVTLLPEDADESARRVRREIREARGVAPAVVISDSFGRPWRLGQADVAIGCAGLAPLEDWRGRRDRFGRELTATAIATPDEAAAAADLARDKASGIPAVLIRGLGDLVMGEDGPGARALRRAEAEDLFR